MIAVTTLKEDTTDNATYNTTWASTDYILIGVPRDLSRYDHDPTGRAYLVNTKPYEAIEVDTRSTGSKSNFPWNQRNFELVGSESPWNMMPRIPSPVWNQSDWVMNSW